MTLWPRLRLSRCHLGGGVRVCAAGLALAIAALPGAALAHVDIDVGDGKYVMEVGFRDEPAYAGQPNAIYLHVGEYATGGTKPVDGLASTLKAEVTRDGQTLSPPLVPLGDGAYQAIFVPTAAGDYTFHVTGAIGDATVDESVTSGPQTFNSVEPLSTIELPAPGAGVPAVETTVQQAQDAAALARNLALVGLVAGVAGLIVAAVALARGGRPAAVPHAPPAGEPTGKLIR